MKLTRENVYISLIGKSKDELTDLYNFLESVGEEQFRQTLNGFLDNCSNLWIAYEFGKGCWLLSSNQQSLSKKTEVTLLQLIEILKPMDLTLKQQLEKAEAEVKRLKEAIKYESEPKVGDWVYSTSGECLYKKELTRYQPHERKIQNPELIKLLENEIK